MTGDVPAEGVALAIEPPAGGPPRTVQAGAVEAAAVEVRGLVKRYDGRPVVDDLSFSIRTGEIFALLGPNGAGKTTTVEILEGYRRADGGEVRVLGFDPATDAAAIRARAGLMLQAGGVYPQVTPVEILRHYGRFHEDPHDPDALLSLVGLDEARRTRYRVLSGGQKQRLGLALALVGRPRLVVLDEPTAGMDPAARVATRALIGRLRDAGVTVLLTTHDLADVERLADTVAVIVRGRLVALGSPAELTAGDTARLRFRLERRLGEGDRIALAHHLAGSPATDRSAETTLVDEGGGRYRLDGLAPAPEVVARLAAWSADQGASIVEVRTSAGTLEEWYLELVSSAGEDGTGDAAASGETEA
ncbi:MAG: ABC transporter ATP-binding protein [Candidatus Limnocylindrales bacterium]